VPAVPAISADRRVDIAMTRRNRNTWGPLVGMDNHFIAVAEKDDRMCNRGVSYLAVFLDFDGTLVEIAERPDLVIVPPDLPTTLMQLEQRLGGALAIVTGRSLDVVDSFLTPARTAVAAAHGSEGRLSSGSSFGPPAVVAASARQIYETLASVVEGEPRLVLEQKAGAAALHFRGAPELEDKCRAIMNDAVAGVEGFGVVEGKCVLEARPVGTDKGTAVCAFMQEPPFRNRTPIFIGDDRTDEDGFAATQSLGGAGIKVGPGATCAEFRAASVTDVHRLLRGWLSDDVSPDFHAGHLTHVGSEMKT